MFTTIDIYRYEGHRRFEFTQNLAVSQFKKFKKPGDFQFSFSFEPRISLLVTHWFQTLVVTRLYPHSFATKNRRQDFFFGYRQFSLGQ